MEIRIESVNKDNSHSWVRISHGMNKLVTDLIDKEYDDNEQKTSETKSEEFALKMEVFTFASRSQGKAKPRRPTSACSSTRTVPIRERILIDIEPGTYSNIAYSVSKRLTTLLRQGHLLRERSQEVLVPICSRFRCSSLLHSITFSNSRRWQQGVGRRGWTVHEDLQHQAWLRVLQGRRPPSVQWPRARPQQQALQPGHTAANEGQKRTQKSQTMRTAGRRPPFVDASAKQTKASVRVKKIKHALLVLGDTEGPEVDGLRAALKRAESDTKVTPIHTQVKECESFLQRARLHMEELDQKRAVVGASISDAEKRLVALESQEACMPAPAASPDASSEVQRLQELVSQLQAKHDAEGQDPDVPCVPTVKRFCRSGQGHAQVHLVPNSIPAELSTWLVERHAEMHDALMNGETARVLEFSSRMSEGAERLMEIFGGMCS